MKSVLAGGTGFLGRSILQSLLADGSEVTVLTRDPLRAARALPSGVTCIRWDGATTGEWVEAVDGADAVINFSGESVGGGRWTARRKRVLLDSRVNPVGALVAAMAQAKKRPGVFVNAAGVGYYGACGDEVLTEESASGTGFLAEMGLAWERAAFAASQLGIRVVVMRMGVVLGDGGVALERMVLPYRLYMGGPLGSGEQWFPWVHRDDVVGVLRAAIGDNSMSGPYNVVSPASVTMRQFAEVLGRALDRPAWLPVPAFALRLLLGEMSEMVLASQRVVPLGLLRKGYRFVYPELLPALKSISL